MGFVVRLRRIKLGVQLSRTLQEVKPPPVLYHTFWDSGSIYHFQYDILLHNVVLASTVVVKYQPGSAICFCPIVLGCIATENVERGGGV